MSGHDRAADKRASQRGQGSVLMVGVVAALLSTFVLLMAMGSAVIAGQQARSAADLAALAASSSAISGASSAHSCGQARQLMNLEGAQLLGCTIDAQGRARVRAGVRVSWRISGFGPAQMTANALAGPGGA